MTVSADADRRMIIGMPTMRCPSTPSLDTLSVSIFEIYLLAKIDTDSVSSDGVLDGCAGLFNGG